MSKIASDANLYYPASAQKISGSVLIAASLILGFGLVRALRSGRIEFLGRFGAVRLDRQVQPFGYWILIGIFLLLCIVAIDAAIALFHGKLNGY